MINGQLTVVIGACLLRDQNEGIVEAKLHATIGKIHIQTRALKSDSNKQFAWQQKFLFKIDKQRVIHFLLTNDLRKGQQSIIGECVINLRIIKQQKFLLLFYWKDKPTATIDVEMILDKKGSKYIEPSKKTKTLTLKFTILSAILSKDMQLIGKMKPYVKVTIQKVSFSTADSKGNDPVWNQQITFQKVNIKDRISIAVYDKQMIGKDDFIGKFNTIIQEFNTQRTYNVQLLNNNKSAGQLKFDLKKYYE